MAFATGSGPSARWSSIWPTMWPVRWQYPAPKRYAPTARGAGCSSTDCDTTAAELIAVVAARYPLHDLTIEEPDIEAIVRRIYEQGLTTVEHEAPVGPA